jgi:hypothetical protein
MNEVCKCGHLKEKHTADAGCTEMENPNDYAGGFCQCRKYEYSELAELDYLRKRETDLLEFLGHFEDCFASCPDCGGIGWHEEGPYETDCPTCLAHGYKVIDYRSLYVLHWGAIELLNRRNFCIEERNYRLEDSD